uniref:Protein kinase domain-containing protein n=1 Tax=Chenopodium quinoa TaxID=63459 RepID=A0A803LHI7_CHEQI
MIPTDHDGGDGPSQTVVVGVKMDALSRELLTWSLVKVAQPGDVVLALHVLAPNEIFDNDGKSSLLSLVKAFDSVLGVYEGFCNLKQVDLKLKICRGSSVRKIIVREANSYAANKVIVGTAVKHHTIRSSTSVAKYCAKKLPQDCSVLAVRNGKVVFQREATAAAGKRKDSKGWANDQQNSILEGLQRSSTINSILNNDDADISPKVVCDEGIDEDLEQTRLKIDALRPEMLTTQTCCICSHSFSSNSSLPCTSMTEEPGDNNQEDNSKALVPFQKLEAASSSVSLLVKELPELRPGWPLLRRRLLSAREGSTSSSSRDISVVQWATSLPSRHYMSTVSSSSIEKNRKEHDANSCDQGVQNNGMVPSSTEIPSHTLDEDSRSALRELEGLHERYSSTCRLFKYEELQSATSNFMPDNLIGKGGSSWVYRGTLSDGKELAVKILKPSEDVLQEFMMEIKIITSLHHKNIISLFGFCFEDSNLLLVYDLLSRGSLEENLHGDKKDPVAFGCNERFKVALGVAEALYYLHNNSSQQIIHRDVKSSNILLSKDFEPRLSDFGFAKWASTSSHITCTDVAGTFGYLAPEYFMYGKVTDKIDVFAFGVVLLELLSGRKPISNELPKGEESLVMWAKPILNGGKVSKLLDPCLGSNYNQDQIERMVLAATLCIRRTPRARPHMRVILKLLQGDPDTIKWARFQVNASDNIDRQDEDGLTQIDLQSHLSLALLDVEDDSLSVSSLEQHVSLEEYLRGRWSRSSSLD